MRNLILLYITFFLSGCYFVNSQCSLRDLSMQTQQEKCAQGHPVFDGEGGCRERGCPFKGVCGTVLFKSVNKEREAGSRRGNNDDNAAAPIKQRHITAYDDQDVDTGFTPRRSSFADRVVRPALLFLIPFGIRVCTEQGLNYVFKCNKEGFCNNEMIVQLVSRTLLGVLRSESLRYCLAGRRQTKLSGAIEGFGSALVIEYCVAGTRYMLKCLCEKVSTEKDTQCKVLSWIDNRITREVFRIVFSTALAGLCFRVRHNKWYFIPDINPFEYSIKRRSKINRAASWLSKPLSS